MKKFMTTNTVKVPYRSPEEVPEKKKPFVFTTNKLKDPEEKPLRKIKDMKPFDPIINRGLNHRTKNVGMTTSDLPSDLTKLKESLSMTCAERSSQRVAQKKAKKEAQVIQEFDSIVPWMGPEGEFCELGVDVYQGLATEEKRAYNLAKAREAKKKKKSEK